MIRLMPGFSEKSRRPGVCSITGNPQKHSVDGDPTSPLEPVVDLGEFIDYEGNLEITLQTAHEIGSVAGMILPETAEDLKSKLADALDRITDLETALSDKEDAVSALAGEVHAAGKELAQVREREYARGYEQGCHDTEVDING